MNGFVPIVLIALAVTACTRPAEESVAHAPAPATAPTPKTETIAAKPPPATSTSEAMTGGDAINDSIITARVKTGILSDPGMAGSDVSVNTDHGVVSLRGTIKSQEQLAIASAHAQQPEGVMRVDNQLAVNVH